MDDKGSVYNVYQTTGGQRKIVGHALLTDMDTKPDPKLTSNEIGGFKLMLGINPGFDASEQILEYEPVYYGTTDWTAESKMEE